MSLSEPCGGEGGPDGVYEAKLSQERCPDANNLAYLLSRTANSQVRFGFRFAMEPKLMWACGIDGEGLRFLWGSHRRIRIARAPDKP